jgi:TPR repeat protein
MCRYNLGICYLEGRIGFVRDDRKGAYWLKVAADRKHRHALFRLALCYNLGLGVQPDGQEAVRLLRRADELNHVCLPNISAARLALCLCRTSNMVELSDGVSYWPVECCWVHAKVRIDAYQPVGAGGCYFQLGHVLQAWLRCAKRLSRGSKVSLIHPSSWHQ